METCKNQFRMTREELCRSMQYHYQLDMRHSLVIAVGVLCGLLTAFSIFVIVGLGAREVSSFGFTAMLVLFTICWWWRLPLFNFGVGWKFSQRPDADKIIEWELSDDMLKMTCEEIAKVEFQWKLIIQVVETSGGFLFYLRKNMFYWLPNSGFDTSESIEKAKLSVAANKIPYSVQIDGRRKKSEITAQLQDSRE